MDGQLLRTLPLQGASGPVGTEVGSTPPPPPPTTVTAALGRFLVQRQKPSRGWWPYLHNDFVYSLDDLVKNSDIR